MGFKKGQHKKTEFKKGHKFSEETLKKISETRKRKFIEGKSIPWNKGLKGFGKDFGFKKGHKQFKKNTKHSEETKIKMRNKALLSYKNGRISPLKGLLRENHPSWKGGKSFEPYTTDWTHSLRISIRERDKYTCQICGEKQGDKVHNVHHIDYNKKNCNSDNLITLCKKCHGKTNSNREYWIEYFKNK